MARKTDRDYEKQFGGFVPPNVTKGANRRRTESVAVPLAEPVEVLVELPEQAQLIKPPKSKE